MACPVLFRRYLILLKSPGRVWEAHFSNIRTVISMPMIEKAWLF